MPKTKTQKKKLMIADGTGSIAETARVLKKRRDLTVYTVKTAEDALALHAEEHADFIIADLNLPEMGGDTLCTRIRSDDELKRVYISLVCNGRKSELQRCGKCGANNYIKLPLDTSDIAERIDRVLELAGNRAERVLVKITVNGMYNHESFFCTSRNISATGMLIETDKTLARGESISCSFFLPDTERVEAMGTVVRIATGEEDAAHAYGIAFSDITDEARNAIHSFIKKILGTV
jgi:CheY-like chemotaxis protein